MQKVLENFFKNHTQVNSNQRFLLAVSGGLDSTVMAELFYRVKMNFAIAHCNFHLRGADSTRDEMFVRALAEKFQVPFFCEEFDTIKFAENQKIGIEEAARKLRYDFFEKILKQEKFDWLATAHHQDDSIETFLFNLLRGTGLSGLHGILPVRNRLIRPFMEVTRKEIEIFAKENQLSYCEDYTNNDTKYARNKIRHQLIPFLKEMQPEFSKVMGNTIERLQGVEKIYQKAVQQLCDEVVTKKAQKTEVYIDKLLQTDAPATVLFEILSPFGFNSAVIQTVYKSLEGESGRIFYSEHFQVVKDRTSLIICEKEQSGTQVYRIEKGQCNIEQPIKLKFEYQQIDQDFAIPKTSDIACFDADKLHFPLVLRHWKKGDFFVPFGMKGRKKLSDFFSDNKFSLIDKQSVWLLCSGYDVIWIVGWRIDERYRVDEKTENVLACEIFND